MPALTFEIESAGAVPHAATPLLALRLLVANVPADEDIQAILLGCQVRIDAERRGYVPAEREKLGDLFGGPSLWGRSLRGLLWTHATVTVPPFREAVRVDVMLPCSADLTVAWAKYFYSLESGQIPLTLHFSGTVFYTADEALKVVRVPWDREAKFRLEVAVWKDMMAAHYPNLAFLSLRADVVDRLYRYRVENGLPTWEHALERLLSTERGS